MAIAFSADSEGAATATSVTFAHTISGSDNILLVGGFVNHATTDVTGVTYNAAALTQIGTGQNIQSNIRLRLYGIINPSSGANNIVVSLGGSIYSSWVSTSYTGVSQSGLPSNVAQASQSGTTSQSIAITTATGNNWVAGSMSRAGGGVMSGSGGTTIREQDGGSQAAMGDEGPNAAGSVTVTWGAAGSDNSGGIVCELVEASTTTVKTWDGVSRATLKTLDAVASESIKTINGVP